MLEYSVERMEAPSLLRLIKSWGVRDEAALTSCFKRTEPAKLQIHYAQIDPYGCVGSAMLSSKTSSKGLTSAGLDRSWSIFLSSSSNSHNDRSIKPSPKLIC